ncbi:Zn(2)-C6 fungal-type domain-containing protein [Fusarium sp. Ph1]|nr:Zn(2)-C6 fungal-type domain-containing protein [Fusarium sp. Ph1]
MSGSRTKTGCWTCRLRRKKCDENKPACVNCTSRNLECYGYDQKPAWMLGKESWQHVLNSDEARAIKSAAEKAYSRRRQKNLPTAPWSAGVIVQDVKELGQPVRVCHPLHSSTVLDRTWSNCTQTLRDCDYAPNYQHVQTFLDVIFPLQWGFFALCKQPDRRWLFDTIISSEPMYHASSGLCISFETGVKAGFTNGTCHVTPEVRKSRLLALQGLQPCIADLQQQKPRNSALLKAIHAIAIILLLSSLEIYGETEGTWEVHLNAAGTVLDFVERQLATSDNVGAIGELLSKSTPSFETRALGLFVATYVWTDILAEAAHGTSYSKPRAFDYLPLLQNGAIDMLSIMGCRNSVMIAIKEVSLLSISTLKDKPPEAAERAKALALDIRHLIQEAASAFTSSDSGLEADSCWVTLLHAYAALVYLQTVTAHEALGDDLDMLQTVTNCLELLEALPTHLLIRVCWPFTVAGSPQALQVSGLEAAYKMVGTCKRIYQTGEPDPALGDYGGQLRGISDALETQLNNTVGPLSLDDTRLRDLASAGKRTIGSSIRLAIKSRLKQGDLNRWEKDLAKAQSAMETQLLVGLRRRLDANILQNDEMDRDLKYFTHELKEEICKRLTDAEASTKTHITTELLHNDNRMQNHVSKALDNVQVVVEKHTQEESASRAQDEGYRRLLGSLKFPDMEARRNHVSHACPETFHWILDSQDSSSDDEYDESEGDWEGDEDNYDDDDDGNDDECRHGTGSTDSNISVSSNSPDSPTWDSLIEWLQSSETVYWISGKQASGKSTLMKFILSHNQTKPLLKQWQDKVRILSHFFWRPGTELQQSIKGLLCSLLHQIFVEDKDQALSYLKARRELCWKDSPSDWDPKELEALFINCLQRPSAAFCLFIDGLDEVWPKDGVNSLTLLLNTLLHKTKHLKLCVSSRREHLLEIGLRDYPQLKMHDLIQNDLKKYATQALGGALAHSNLDSWDIREIIWGIVDVSDGVFL